MRRYTILIWLTLLFFSCTSHKNAPDVSAIKLTIQTERFEKDFFAIDTLHLDASLQKLYQKYPGFMQDFLFNILGTTKDSAQKDVPLFLRSYLAMYETAARKYTDFSKTEAAIKKGLQYVHYYYPEYPLPQKITTFIGPLNSYANIITPGALAIGLQLYLGKDYPLYLSEQGQQLYPLFISKRFEPEYIPVNCIRNIIDDIYPDKSTGRPLVEQMVEAGKRLYLMDKFLPGLPDTLKIGYTKQQLDGCYESEKNIWSFFVQNDLLYNTDPNLTRDYMNDGPNTPALGEASPGNIGQFTGWQIVNKWMEKNEKTSLKELMQKPAKQIFEEAKYKPR